MRGVFFSGLFFGFFFSGHRVYVQKSNIQHDFHTHIEVEDPSSSTPTSSRHHQYYCEFLDLIKNEIIIKCIHLRILSIKNNKNAILVKKKKKQNIIKIHHYYYYYHVQKVTKLYFTMCKHRALFIWNNLIGESEKNNSEEMQQSTRSFLQSTRSFLSFSISTNSKIEMI